MIPPDMNKDVKNFIDQLSVLLEDVSLPQFQTLERLPHPEDERGKNIWGHIKAGMAKGYESYKKDPKAALAMANPLFKGGHNRALITESNPKIEKLIPAKTGKNPPSYKAMGLTLSPSDEAGAGINLCPCATKECRDVCLNFTGQGRLKPPQDARVHRTKFMVEHPDHFAVILHHEINKAKNTVGGAGAKLAFRPNMVSDVAWEHIHPQLFTEHKDVQFYDYTKIAGRTKKQHHDNYHITLSSSGVAGEGSNWNHVREHLDKGGVSAMVFDARKHDTLPTHLIDHQTNKKYRVIDGDKHDHRHFDKEEYGISGEDGVIAGLRFKHGGHKRTEFMEKAGNFVVPHDGVHAHVNHPETHPRSNISENYHAPMLPFGMNPVVYLMNCFNRR